MIRVGLPNVRRSAGGRSAGGRSAGGRSAGGRSAGGRSAGGRSAGGRSAGVSVFQRIPDVKFCKTCGYMIVNKADDVCVCGNDGGFLNGDIAEVLGGYLELNRNKLLKGHYLKRNKNSKSVMNNKRLVVWLLVHHDRLIRWDDTETIDIVYKAFRNDIFRSKPC